MEIVRSLTELKNCYDRIIVAVGNFDGVHRGHQQLMREVVETAAKMHGTAVVLTFEPHPSKILQPHRKLPLLLTTRRKAEIIASFGIDVLVLLPFNRELAGMDPALFAKEVLGNYLNAKVVCVGYNFTFGQSGKGTPSLLETYGQQYRFQVIVIPPFIVSGVVVSSTAVREALARGDIQRVRNYLGYWPLLEGIVVTGTGVGRHLGFPTANLAVDHQILLPAKGVYVARVKLADQWFSAVVNIGNKPTLGDSLAMTVEVHLLDYAGDLYGAFIIMELRYKLRDEQKFSSVAALVRQIKEDLQAARSYLSVLP